MNIYGSAKGGVTLPNKNNSSVAFGGAVTEELCQLLSSNYGMPMKTGTVQRAGVKLLDGSTWIDKTINTVKFWLMWNSVGTGTCYARIYRDGTTEAIHTFGGKDITTIATGTQGYPDPTNDWEEVTFTGDDGDYTLLENDIICCENDNGTSAIVFIDPYFDGVINYNLQMRYSTSWSEAAGESMKMCIS